MSILIHSGPFSMTFRGLDVRGLLESMLLLPQLLQLAPGGPGTSGEIERPYRTILNSHVSNVSNLYLYIYIYIHIF